MTDARKLARLGIHVLDGGALTGTEGHETSVPASALREEERLNAPNERPSSSRSALRKEGEPIGVDPSAISPRVRHGRSHTAGGRPSPSVQSAPRNANGRFKKGAKKPLIYTAVCQMCRAEFSSSQPTETCSPACKQRAYRQRQGERYLALERARQRRRKRVDDPVKKHAWNVAADARRHGRLTPQPCELCGEPETQAHHDDYTKPLDVRWLCVPHHMDLHHPGRTSYRVELLLAAVAHG